MKALVVLKPKRHNVDKDQRKHLQGRVSSKSEHLLDELRRSLCMNRWDEPEEQAMEPPEVQEARRVIRAYELQRKKIWDKQHGILDRLRQWLNEQVLFRPSIEALQFLRVYESMGLTEAIEAASSMEDRNDVPVCMPTVKLLSETSHQT